MTVKELMEALKGMPENADVYIYMNEEVDNAVQNCNALCVKGIKEHLNRCGHYVDLICEEE